MSITTPEELEFLELARGVRRVRTPEGSQFYGLPIGAPITADVIAAKKAEAAAVGATPPSGGLSKGAGASTSGGKGGAGGKTPVAVGAPDPDGEPKKSNLKIVHKPSTIKGPKKFKVGEKAYTAPEGSVLIKPVDLSGLVYVRTPDGEIHAFNEADEVEIPTTLKNLFTNKFSEDFKGDDKYGIEEFDTESEKPLSDLPVNSTLDADGEPQFKKLENGDWEHIGIGAVLSESDIQPLYDSGELTLTETPEGQDDAGLSDYASMEADEFQEALKGLPEGYQLYIAKAVVTKNKDGKWTSSLTGNSNDIPSGMRKYATDKPAPTDDEIAAADAKSKGEEPSVPKVEKPAAVKVEKPVEKAPEAAPAKPAAEPKAETPAVKNHARKKYVSPQNGEKPTKPEPVRSDGKIGTHHSASDSLAKEMGQYKSDLAQWEKDNGPQKNFKKKESTPKLDTTTPILPEDISGKQQGDKLRVDDGDIQMILTKNQNGEWEDAKGDTFSDELVGSDAREGFVYNYEYTRANLKAAEPGDKLMEMLPDGKKNFFTKQDNNTWKHDTTGVEYPQTALYGSVEDGLMSDNSGSPEGQSFSEEDAARFEAELEADVAAASAADFEAELDAELAVDKTLPVPDGVYIVKDMKGLAVGDTVLQNQPDGSVAEYKKADDYYWEETATGLSINEGAFAAAMKGGEIYKNSRYAPGENVAAHLPKLAAGTVVKHHTAKKPGSGLNVSDISYQKNEDGSWSAIDLKEGQIVPDKSNDELKQMAFGSQHSLVFVSGSNDDFVEPPKVEKPVNDDTILKTDKALAALPNGSVIERSDGIILTKNANGQWVDEFGVTNQNVLFFANKKKLTLKVVSVPEGADPIDVPEAKTKTVKDLKQGDLIGGGTILKTEKGVSTPVGKTEVWYETPGGVTKKGVWWDGTNIKLAEKKEKKDTAPDLTPAPDKAPEPAPVTVAPADVPEDVSAADPDMVELGIEGKQFSKADVNSAIDSLEAHSGFQIGYGLKAVPNNPIADKETQASILAAAKKDFPKLKPKPAFVAYLKSKAGVRTKKKKTNSDASQINIGSKTPQETPQGPDGGVYSSDDIQDAVDILEAYDGKFYVNELNKKGNPLGELNFNDIVGFSPDKLETKKKVIDLLKTKLNRDKKSKEDNPISPEMEQALQNPSTELADWEKELMEVDDFVQELQDPNVYSADDVAAMKVGDRVFVDISSGKQVYTLGADDKWHNPKGGSIYPHTMNARANMGLVTKPTPEQLAEADAVAKEKASKVSVEEIESMVEGDMVLMLPKEGYSGKEHEYTKQSDGDWTSPTGLDTTNDMMEYRAAQGRIKKYVRPDPAPTVAPPVPESQKVPDVPEGSDVIKSLDEIKAAPVGDFMAWSMPDGSPTVVKKLDNGAWEPQADGLVGKGIELQTEAFESYVSDGLMFKTDKDGTPLSKTGDELFKQHDPAAAVPYVEMASAEDAGLSVLAPELRGKSGDGFVVVNTPKGPKGVWGRYGAGGVATVAVDKDGTKKVLVGKRGDRDEWYLPGGAIDEKESHLEGAFREFTEEVEGGEVLLKDLKTVSGHEAVVGKIDGTDKDWKYVTVVADLGEVIEIKAPKTSEPWELSEYQWFDADELKALDDSGKLHGALSGGALAKMVGFEKGDVDAFDTDFIPSNGPEDLSTPKYNITNWKQVGGQGGFNAGGVFEDETGNKYYVKSPAAEANAHNEVLASSLYSSLGVNNNRVYLGQADGSDKLMLVSPWVENDAKAVPTAIAMGDTEFLKKVQSDFAIDAWLSNYDVAGNDTWNLVADDNGDPLRIDPGGALMFRGTGAKKAWWNSEINDIDDMRFGASMSGSFAKASAIFGSMTEDDVAESAKKLQNITDAQIVQLVGSSGFSIEDKDQLAATLIARRKKILERFNLADTSAVDEGGADLPAESFTPKYAVGTKVKVKGTGQVFEVEISTNEFAAGKAPGALIHTILLNDELDTEDAPAVSKDYAFSSNGKTFETLEDVMIPAPAGFGMVKAQVLGADWNNGQVSVKVGDDIVTLDKMNIQKKGAPAMDLPEGYAPPPEGSKVVGVTNEVFYEVYAVENSSGDIYLHEPDGKTYGTFGETFEDIKSKSPGYWKDLSQESAVDPKAPSLGGSYAPLAPGATVSIVTKKNPDLVVYGVTEPDGSDKYYYPDGATYPVHMPFADHTKIGDTWEKFDMKELEPKVEAPKDISGTPLHVGDKISIVKNNKGGGSNKGRIVSFNSTTGKVRVQRLDEMGNPALDENGKKKYATLDAQSLRRDLITAQDSNLPTGITMSQGDKDHPLYGTPSPTPPKVPENSAVAELGDEWRERAEAAYAIYRSNKGLPEKKLNETSNWPKFQQAMAGDQEALDFMKSKGYFGTDEKLFEELELKLAEVKANFDSLMAEHELRVKAFQIQREEWIKANGAASYTPILHSDTLGMNVPEAQSWMAKTFKGLSGKLSKKAKDALMTQKGSSGWQKAIRKLPQTLGMKRADVAAVTPSEFMDVWDGAQQASQEAGPVGVAWRGIRTVSALRFEDANGNRFSNSEADLTVLKGTIQKDHGAAEWTPGSLDHGGKPGFGGSFNGEDYDILVDMAVPPQIAGVGTGVPGDDFGFATELGFIAEPGTVMYIWDVIKINEYHTTIGGSEHLYKWKIIASLIPKDVLPYMNNFEGNPAGHNILLPKESSN